jgi:hypothetical protein
VDRILDFGRSHSLLSLVVGAAAGATVGFFAYVVTQLTGVLLFVVLGALLGFAAAAVLVIARGRLQVAEATISFPQLGSIKFVVDDKDRQVAWQLFVETATRISTQPLGPKEGILREALDSLYSLFSITRELLRGMSPSQASEGETVETAAVAMLNKVLRPFLSKWHPLLKAFESVEPKRAEQLWEHNEEFRQDLERLRQQLLEYARGYGELAGVSQLDKLLSGDEQPVAYSRPDKS